MEKHFAIYMNNPTAGGVDGVKISEGGIGTNPLTAELVANQSDTQVIKCALRCDDGYVIQSYTTVSFAGTTADKWKVAADNNFGNATIAAQNGDWQDEIVLESVTSVNKVFWVRASSSANESVANDASVTITASGEVGVG